MKRKKVWVMKKFSIYLVLILLFAGGCSDEQSETSSAPQAESAVRVGFSLGTVPDTDFSLEPMTRATAWKEWFTNKVKVLVLKKIDSRWIVDSTREILIDGGKDPWNEIKLATDSLPACKFDWELLPGDYRAVAVLNPGSGIWNDELIAGKVVADTADPTLQTPPLITYAISTHPANTGYRQLSREVFVAVTDFTVPKSGDLHATGVPRVQLRAERRVGKFRMLLKDTPPPPRDEKDSVSINYVFGTTAHTGRFLFKALEKPFPEGIDALGGTYYGTPGLYELEWCMSTTGDFHVSGEASYLMCQTNSTVFSPFLFADPQTDSIPFRISVVRIDGASGGYCYQVNGEFDRTLTASRITGIVFRVTNVELAKGTQTLVEAEEVTDDAGRPEDASALFDAFYEWNAAYN